MNVENLKHMVLILEEVIEADGGFNLDTWADADEHCGTSCCAMGYAALDPKFIAQGLRLEVEIYARNRKTGAPAIVKSVPRSVIVDYFDGQVGTCVAIYEQGTKNPERNLK